MKALVSALVTVAAVLAFVVAACGDGGGESTATGVTETAPVVDDYPADPEAAETLDRFIQAAGAGDTAAMWNLLDSRSQQRFGPTEQLWSDGSGGDLAVVLGSFANEGGGYESVLSRRISDLWSVAAVQGFVPAGEDTEWGAYAAVVGHESGERKISLAGTATFNPVVPEPELKSDATPDVATEVEAAEPILTAALWVDETLLATDVSPDELFLTSRVTTPLEPKRHTIVSYADTQSGAGANAWTFVSR